MILNQIFFASPWVSGAASVLCKHLLSSEPLEELTNFLTQGSISAKPAWLLALGYSPASQLPFTEYFSSSVGLLMQPLRSP